MAKKRSRKRTKRVATRQDLTVRNRRAIDKVLEATKRSLLSHLESLRSTIATLEKRINELENSDKR